MIPNRFIRFHREGDLDLYIEDLGEMMHTSLLLFTQTVPGDSNPCTGSHKTMPTSRSACRVQKGAFCGPQITCSLLTDGE